MNLKEIDYLVTKIERDEFELTNDHEIVKAMQEYMNDLHKARYSIQEIRNHIVWSCRQFSINYSTEILLALEALEKVSESIRKLAPLEFVGLDAVEAGDNRLWYTDRPAGISESVPIPEHHDDMTIYEDAELAEELQRLVVSAYEETE